MANSAKDALLSAINDAGITMTTEFIPWSNSRNAKEKHRSLNWKVTLHHNGREMLTTDYSAGVGHAPSYKQLDNSLVQAALIKYETEHGYAGRWSDGSNRVMPRAAGKQFGHIQPDICDVVHSLILDSEVIDYRSFEEWASEFGYDGDSRNAETIYRACLTTALQLRNSLGDETVKALREAGQKY